MCVPWINMKNIEWKDGVYKMEEVAVWGVLTKETDNMQ